MIGKLISAIRDKLLNRKGPDPLDSINSKSVSKATQKKRSTPRQKTAATGDEHAGREKTAPRIEPSWDREAFVVPVQEGKTRFHDLDVADPVLHAIADIGFSYCTPIQAEILPATLNGQDAFGRAQTGTGKTAAFLIAVLTRMIKAPRTGKLPTGRPRVLIIAPTRELVLQIADEARLLAKYTRFSIVNVFGGMDYEKQRRQLVDKVVDIVVATPGRLLDFKRRKDLDLSKVEMLVIDEADRMLDMGFIPDVRQIVYSTPHKDKRQTLFFSATLTPDVTRLCTSWTRDPVSVEIEPEQVAVDTVEQLVYIVTSDEKFALTYNTIVQKNLERVIVFCNRRDETRKLADMLDRYRIDCAVLSGEVPQKKRIRTLDLFKNGKIRVLVATDVAGRGIHIEGMEYVINFTLPHDPEDYVHRIGRTGRAGAAGTSISFADEEDSFYIPAIEAYMGHPLSCVAPDEKLLDVPPPLPRRRKPKPAESGEGTSTNRGQRRRRRPSGGQGRPPRRQGQGGRPPRSRRDSRPRSKGSAPK